MEYERIKPKEAAEFEAFIGHIEKKTAEIDKETTVFFRVVVNLETKKGGPRITTTLRIHHLGNESEENNPLLKAMKSLVALNELTKLMTPEKAQEFMREGAMIHLSDGDEVQFYRWNAVLGMLEAVVISTRSEKFSKLPFLKKATSTEVKTGPLRKAKHIQVKLGHAMKDHISRHSKYRLVALLRKAFVGAATIGNGAAAFGGLVPESGVFGFLAGGLVKMGEMLYEKLGIYTYSQHARRLTAYIEHRLEQSELKIEF